MSEKDQHQSCENGEASCKDELFSGIMSLFALADEEEERLKNQSNESK